MKTVIKLLPYIVIVALMFFIFFSKCTNSPSISKGGDKVESDTIYVTKVIKGETITKTQTKFVPTYVENEVNKDLLDKVEKLKSDNERVTFLLNELKTKVYDTTYNIKGRGSLSIRDSVQGNLLGREWSIKFDDITYEEGTITNAITKYPNFTFSLGIDTGVSTNFVIFEKPFIGAVVGFKNRKGYDLTFGYNTLKQFKVQLKKDIFTHYKK